jgi:hypothetical protein
MSEETRARIKAIAEAEKIPEAQVGRDLIHHSLAWREQLAEKRTYR